jgi:hypothetical protein
MQPLSIVSELGGGAHDLLGLVLPPASYATLTSVTFHTPINPGKTPNIEAGETTAQINEAVRQHKENLRVWRAYIATGRALQQQLINPFDKPYIQGLHDRHTSYNNASSMHILTHLYTAPSIRSALRTTTSKCEHHLILPNPSNSFLIKLKPPLHLQMQVTGPTTLTKLSHDHISSSYRRDWRRHAVLTQTWPNFKAGFAKAHRDLRIAQTAAHGAGYQNVKAQPAHFMLKSSSTSEQVMGRNSWRHSPGVRYVGL